MLLSAEDSSAFWKFLLTDMLCENVIDTVVLLNTDRFRDILGVGQFDLDLLVGDRAFRLIFLYGFGCLQLAPFRLR